MSPEDLYLHAVINRHRASTHKQFPRLERLIHSWGGKHLESIAISGSHAKSTALRDSDVDLFLSLASGPLSPMQASLAEHFRYYSPELRNVSVRIRFEGDSIDLVPGRRRPNSTAHTLWQSRRNTWIQTDIAEQTRHVRSSGLIDEILALKIWRRRHALHFPSFILELATIRALKPSSHIAESFLTLLHYLATDFPTARLTDPANSNNIVSDLLTPADKNRIAQTAQTSLLAPTWPEIL